MLQMECNLSEWMDVEGVSLCFSLMMLKFVKEHELGMD